VRKRNKCTFKNGREMFVHRDLDKHLKFYSSVIVHNTFRIGRAAIYRADDNVKVNYT